MTPQEARVLALVVSSGDNGQAASQIVRASWEWPAELRVWSSQSAGHLARRLVARGLIEPRRYSSTMRHYVATDHGRRVATANAVADAARGGDHDGAR